MCERESRDEIAAMLDRLDCDLLQWELQGRELFGEVWSYLAELGQCDAFGGAAYLRVLDEWTTRGRPVDVRAFIVRRANLPPPRTLIV